MQKNLNERIQRQKLEIEAAHQTGLTIWEMEKYLVEKGFKSSYSIEDLKKIKMLGKGR